MAFRRDFETAFMPFPKDLAMHDWWIGLNAELKGKVEFIYEPLIKHRCHGGNVTGGKTTAAQKSRKMLCSSLVINILRQLVIKTGKE